jgi:hypothetical protein
VDVRKLIQQLDHPIVVFEGVQAYPGKAIFSGDQVLVKRLMLVP